MTTTASGHKSTGLLACLLAWLSLVVTPAALAGGPAVGQLAPNWLLKNAQGQAVMLYEQADAGRNTLMLFWSSWCQRCEQIMPLMAQLQGQVGEGQMVSFALSIWDDKSLVARLQQQPQPLPVLLQADEVARRFNVSQTATVILVGPDKRVRFISEPDMPTDALARQLRHLLQPTSGATSAQPIRAAR
jgi:thiol-disulfide isomerase/thioredoxin